MSSAIIFLFRDGFFAAFKTAFADFLFPTAGNRGGDKLIYFAERDDRERRAENESPKAGGKRGDIERGSKRREAERNVHAQPERDG